MDLVDVTAVQPDGVPPWRDEAWLEAAAAWIDERLAEAGLRRAGTPALRGRMWSVVVRVPVEGARAVWFKANPPGSAYEPGLLAALGRWVPGLVPPPIAVDTVRAWTLTQDAGTHLREILREDPDPERMRPLLQRYARMQRALTPRQQELLALGVPDLRPQVLPRRFAAHLADPAVRAQLTDEQHARLTAFMPVLRDRCRELARLGIPASLEHGDLHPNNVFGSGRDALAFDWGDASLAHPFGTLLVLLRSVDEFFDADGIARLRAAYLESWLQDGHRAVDLERAAHLAMLVAPISRASAWVRNFPCFAHAMEPTENAGRWLVRLLDDDPLGDDAEAA
jgi:hypothetical protein